MVTILHYATSNVDRLTVSPVMAVKIEWIATAAMLAGSVASSIFGGVSAAKKARKAAQERNRRNQIEDAWYQKEYNTDYLDTKAGQNLLRKAQEVQDNYIRKASGSAAVGGATQAAEAQAKEAANKAMGDTIANIASQDTARKQQVADSHRQALSQQSREREAAYTQEAANVTQASSQASNALMSGAMNQLGSQATKVKAPNTNALATSQPAVDTSAISKVGENLPNYGYGKGVNGLGLDPLQVATGVTR